MHSKKKKEKTSVVTSQVLTGLERRYLAAALAATAAPLPADGRSAQFGFAAHALKLCEGDQDSDSDDEGTPPLRARTWTWLLHCSIGQT